MLRTRRPLLALLLLGVLLAGGYLVSALRSDGSTDSMSSPARPGGEGNPTRGPAADRTAAGAASPGAGLATVRVADLPVEARRVLRQIDAGGPFPYAEDGTVFGNRERLLPARPRGWYREYTVPTPGEDDRGARRIVAGRDGVRYYTSDHYDSFTRVEDP